MSQQSHTVVVGGGIAGLLAAHLARARDPRQPVTIIEQSPEVGGLLGKVDGEAFGTFDLGMHTMTQTGVPELDRMLWSLLPDEDWFVFEGSKRDISGTYFQGRLQRHTHYPDLRALPREDYTACLVDLLEHLQKPQKPPSGQDMESFALSRFGPEITRRVIEPLMRRTYDRPARQISTLASVLLRLDRIVLFDEPFFQELMGSPTLRSCVAYPEQRNLDLSYASGRGSYYPRLFGIHRVIDALVERCRVQGIETRVSTGVEEIGIERGAVSSLTLSSGQRLPVHSLIWTAGVIPLARKLGVHPVGLPADPPLSTAIVNFLFDHPTDMEDLYYFYCLDPGYRAYRITNFSAYCPNAPRAGGWPICVELLQLPGQSLEANLLKEQALAELRGFGVLPPAAKVLFSDARVLERGFPLPSVDNMNLIGKCREAIAAAELSNLQMMGVLSKPGLFFQTDVVRDVWENVMAGNACAA